MTDLCRLAEKYGTDKTFYTPFYSLLLEKRRGTIKSVLEIGIGTQAAMKHVPDYKPGASLRMWEEYFPKAYIYGMDKDASVLFETERIYTFKGVVPWTFEKVISQFAPFDLIVDDGSHDAADQLLAVQKLLLHLSVGGIYIIEDVNAADGLLEKLVVPHCVVDVKHKNLTGHCVVIS